VKEVATESGNEAEKNNQVMASPEVKKKEQATESSKETDKKEDIADSEKKCRPCSNPACAYQVDNSTPPAMAPMDEQPQIKMLQDMGIHADKEVLQSLLVSCDGDMNIVIETLLQMHQ